MIEVNNKYYVGIDIGSTAAKIVVLDENTIVDKFTLPTGWSGKEAAQSIYNYLEDKGYCRNDAMTCVATGYGRICVDYANKVVTEITCHGKGGWALFKKNCTIIDVGGQDTKIITVENGQVKDFLMNDKCAAGTGKFIEIMAMRLGTSLDEFYEMAKVGNPLAISAMCTVFAESEVISHIGAGKKREDIAAGVIHSVATRVAHLCTRHGTINEVVLTGGLCDSPYFLQVLAQKLGKEVVTHPFARYAGALGAALTALRKTSISLETD